MWAGPIRGEGTRRKLPDTRLLRRSPHWGEDLPEHEGGNVLRALPNGPGPGINSAPLASQVRDGDLEDAGALVLEGAAGFSVMEPSA